MPNSNTNKKNFIRWLTRPGSVTRDEMCLCWTADHGVGNIYAIPTGDGNLEYYVDKDKYNECILKISKWVSENSSFHLSAYDEAREKMISNAQKITQLLDQDTKIISEAYKQYLKAAWDFSIYLMVPHALKDYIEPELSKTLGDDFFKVTALGKQLTFHHFQKSLLEESVEEVTKKYGWVNVFSIKHKPYTQQEIQKLQDNLDRSAVINSLKEIEENEKTFNSFLSTIKDPRIKEMVILSHTYAFLRTDRIDAWKDAMFSLTPFIEYLANKIGDNCTLESAGELYSHEMISFLEEGIKPSVEELNLRFNHKGVFEYGTKSGRFITDEKEIKVIHESFTEVVKENQLKGVIASKGIACGVVRIVLTDKDFEKFKEGDVMVAPWTEPKFTSYMKLASAIVTDEGGLTSHAAIVSRELRIPCVIGTKNATKVLKDGDMVEVDANTGVVRIIK